MLTDSENLRALSDAALRSCRRTMAESAFNQMLEELLPLVGHFVSASVFATAAAYDAHEVLATFRGVCERASLKTPAAR